MDMELITQIFEVCIIPLLGVLTTFLVRYINAKMKTLADTTNDEKKEERIF